MSLMLSPLYFAFSSAVRRRLNAYALRSASVFLGRFSAANAFGVLPVLALTVPPRDKRKRLSAAFAGLASFNWRCAYPGSPLGTLTHLGRSPGSMSLTKRIAPLMVDLIDMMVIRRARERRPC